MVFKIRNFIIKMVYFAFIIFQDIYFFKGKLCNINCELITKYSQIGIGSMNVSDKIFDRSKQIQYYSKTPINDTMLGIEYPDFPSPIWVQGPSPRGYWPRKYTMHGITLCEIHNTVFTTECVIIKENGYHTFKHACHPRYWKIGQPYHTPHITYEMYDKVICIGHQHSSDWGHWFLEVFPGYIALPSELLNDCVVCVPFAKDFIINNFESIGVKSWQIIEGDNKRYYANTLYTIESLWCGDLNRFLLVNMKRFFNKKFELDLIKPSKCLIYNRAKGMSRRLKNIDEFMAAVREKWPQFIWECILPPPNIEDCTRYFASLKLFFGIHGSILANEIFMHAGTSVVELQMSSWLLSFVNLGPMTGIHQIVGRDSNIKYKSLNETTVDLNYLLKLIKAGLIAAKYINDA